MTINPSAVVSQDDGEAGDSGVRLSGDTPGERSECHRYVARPILRASGDLVAHHETGWGTPPTSHVCITLPNSQPCRRVFCRASVPKSASSARCRGNREGPALAAALGSPRFVCL